MLDFLKQFSATIASILFLCQLAFSSSAVFAQASYYFHDAHGHVISQRDLKNKWIIVNYWAEWCDSCRDEIPELNQFYWNNKNKNIVILGVNYDKLKGKKLADIIKQTGIQFPVLQEDPAKVWKLDQVNVLPTTFVINASGDVVKKVIGPNTERSLLKVVYNRVFVKDSKRSKASDLA